MSKNAGNYKLKGKPKKCGKFKHNRILSKNAEITTCQLKAKSAGNFNFTELCQKMREIQI